MHGDKFPSAIGSWQISVVFSKSSCASCEINLNNLLNIFLAYNTTSATVTNRKVVRDIFTCQNVVAICSYNKFVDFRVNNFGNTFLIFVNTFLLIKIETMVSLVIVVGKSKNVKMYHSQIEFHDGLFVHSCRPVECAVFSIAHKVMLGIQAQLRKRLLLLL